MIRKGQNWRVPPVQYPATRPRIGQQTLPSISDGTAFVYLAVLIVGVLAVIWQWTPFWSLVLPGSGRLWLGAIQILTHAAFAIAAQRFLSKVIPALGYAWPYRIGFLLSVALGIALWLEQFSTLPLAHLSVQLGSILSGAFLGGLVATSRDRGLVEDSYPPEDNVRREVLRYHHAVPRPLPEPPGKRQFDWLLAGVVLFLSAPLWVLLMFCVWFEDPGPIFFIKNSVGKGGVNFRQLKFRSMVWGAETETGPVPACKDDGRILAIGRLLRRSALDELPQLLNILRGEMSFVGPRPLRTVVVHNYLMDLPQFAERHRVRPGIAGLSQVMAGYYVSPLQRLRFDRIYIDRRSMALDVKIVLLAFLTVVWFGWANESGSPVPHRLVQLGRR